MAKTVFSIPKNDLPFVWRIGGTVAMGGIIGIAAAIGGKTPDIVDDVNAAIAFAALAARLFKNKNLFEFKSNHNFSKNIYVNSLVFGNFFLDFF